MFLIRGIVFSHGTVRDWEAKLTPALAESLRRRRRGGTVQTLGGSCRFDKGWVFISQAVNSMPEPGSEGAVVNRATNMEQQIGAGSPI
jgi:transposase-like protein